MGGLHQLALCALSCMVMWTSTCSLHNATERKSSPQRTLVTLQQCAPILKKKSLSTAFFPLPTLSEMRGGGGTYSVSIFTFFFLPSPFFLLTHLSTRKLLYWLKKRVYRERNALLSEQDLVSLPSRKQELRNN